jgi:response regulator of citrate/malate metabolism
MVYDIEKITNMENIKFQPLIYLFAENGFSNYNTRNHLKDIGFENIVTVINAEHLLQEIFHEPDMIILDMELNDPFAGPLLKAIRNELPQCDVSFLVHDENIDDIRNLLNYGAFNYVPKDVNFSSKLKRIFNSLTQWNNELRTF